MKHQLNLMNQLQELILTRDEHMQTGVAGHMEALDANIADLMARLEMPGKGVYQRLYKRNHIVMSAMVKGCCAACGMRLPISQVQQVRQAKTIQTCANCGRILFNEEEDAPRHVDGAPRTDPRKTGIQRFSAEELCVPRMKAQSPAEAIRELADAMVRNQFVSNAPGLVAAAMEREILYPTSLGHDVAFPHVRGVEGGGLVMAIGTSENGIDWDGKGEKVHIVCFTVIPVAVSPFYLRLMGALGDAFLKKDTIPGLIAADTPAVLWKAISKATRHTVK